MKKTEIIPASNYIPNPILLNDNSLPVELHMILDDLAKNVHEEWAAGRIREGWKYGKQRNDDLKEHPTIVPYEELPESEKEYDRRTVMTTLSYLIEKGYEIKLKEQ